MGYEVHLLISGIPAWPDTQVKQFYTPENVESIGVYYE